MTAQQLHLPLLLSDNASFENFYSHGENEVVVHLRGIATGTTTPGVSFIWGDKGCGKTHLLQATCKALAEEAFRCHYIPLTETTLTPAVLEKPNQRLSDIVYCLDDIDSLQDHGDDGNAGQGGHGYTQTNWSEAIFALAEGCRSGGYRLIVSANRPPIALNLPLPDLTSRLAGGHVYRVPVLSDADKISALVLRARLRGIELAEDVARYILHRYPRNTSQLFGLLDQIDHASLAAQRRITIPFLKQFDSQT